MQMHAIIFNFLPHPFSGEINVFYVFLQKVLGWTLTEYTPLNCTSIVASGKKNFTMTTQLLRVSLLLFSCQLLHFVSCSLCSFHWDVVFEQIFGSGRYAGYKYCERVPFVRFANTRIRSTHLARLCGECVE